MELSGSIEIARPAHEVVAALYDPSTLARLLPPQAGLTARGRGDYAFTLTRTSGPFTLNLPVTLRLDPQGLGFGQRLTARATHLLAGKVALDLRLDLIALPLSTRLNWTGSVTGSGMAGRALQDNAVRVQDGAAAVVAALRRQIENPG